MSQDSKVLATPGYLFSQQLCIYGIWTNMELYEFLVGWAALMEMPVLILCTLRRDPIRVMTDLAFDR